MLPITQRLTPTLSKNTPQVETKTVSPEESEVPSVDTEDSVKEEKSEEVKGIIALSADATTRGDHLTILSINSNMGGQQVVSTFNISSDQQRNSQYLELRPTTTQTLARYSRWTLGKMAQLRQAKSLWLTGTKSVALLILPWKLQ